MRDAIRRKVDLGMGVVLLSGVAGLAFLTGSRPWSITTIALLGLGLSAGVAFLGAGLNLRALGQINSARLSGAGVALIGLLLLAGNLGVFGGYEGTGTVIGFVGLIGGVFATGIGVNRAIGRDEPDR
ncbi:MAG: hypothetical protein A07HR60_00117 [uncultured archaeon A07HR60]|nr:MAG: hypothetical protein A07HR60_00117 [uncultured archaeon A07HR60]